MLRASEDNFLSSRSDYRILASVFKTEDGHLVRSKSETLIDNWLYNRGVPHGYEGRVEIPEEMLYDFYVPAADTYIEYWGLEDDEEYRKRMEEKIQLYRRHGLKLIELREKDVQRISDVMGKHFGKYIKRTR